MLLSIPNFFLVEQNEYTVKCILLKRRKTYRSILNILTAHNSPARRMGLYIIGNHRTLPRECRAYGCIKHHEYNGQLRSKCSEVKLLPRKCSILEKISYTFLGYVQAIEGNSGILNVGGALSLEVKKELECDIFRRLD